MTATVLFERLRQLKPIPAEIDDTILLDWLNQVEGQILHEIFLLDLSEITPYSATPTEALAAPYPYDGIYLMWMEAQVDFSNGEYERYTNTMQRYNAAWNDLARHIAKCIRPVYGRAVEQGYYLSAYGIAKAHGYTGTEAEWLASLKGAAGEPGKDGKPFQWRGAWDAAATYAHLDAVEHNGSCYVWTDDADSTAGDEPGVDELWELCAAKGSKGDPGAAGAPGPQGDPGAAGAPGPQGDPGADYALTEADKTEIADKITADGLEFALSDFPTALKNPNALTFTGAATGTYDGSAALTVNIPAGGASGSGGALKAMSAVDGYIGIPAAELPENGMVWMCFGSGDSTELYTGTVTIQDAGIAVNDMLVITNGTVNPLIQVAWVSDGLAIYDLSTSDYRGVYQVVGAGGAAEAWEEIRTLEISEDIVKTTISTDNDGAPFSLKKIYIEIKVVPPTNTDITYNATVCCAFNGNDPWGAKKVNLGESPKTGESHAILMISGFDSYAGKIIPVFVKAPDGQSTANILTNGKGGYDSRGAFSVGALSDTNVPALSPCRSIAIGSYRLSLFAGTTIKIYGVRA